MRGDNRGFTLIELLVVIAIIGILAAIAIPQFAAYRQRGYNARAMSDLRNALAAQEALYADTESYASCQGSGCNSPVLPGFQISEGVHLNMEPAGDGLSFTGASYHALGDMTYNFNSTEGTISGDSGIGDGGGDGSGW